MTKTFDTSTLEGLKAAERYKARLEGKFEKVTVVSVGSSGAPWTLANVSA